MTAPGLTSEAQLRYILQWFGEFSELQREDFVPILAAAKSGDPDQLATALAALSCQDKPVSLFQCRIKLFNEWYPTWSVEEQERLVQGVSDIDADFGAKLREALEAPKENGEMNGTGEAQSPEPTPPTDDEPCADGDNEEQHQEVIEVEENPDMPSVQENVSVEIAAAS